MGDVEALKTAAEATGMALLGIVMVAAVIRLLRPPRRCGHWRMRQMRQKERRQAERLERGRRRRRQRLAGSGP